MKKFFFFISLLIFGFNSHCVTQIMFDNHNLEPESASKEDIKASIDSGGAHIGSRNNGSNRNVCEPGFFTSGERKPGFFSSGFFTSEFFLTAFTSLVHNGIKKRMTPQQYEDNHMYMQLLPYVVPVVLRGLHWSYNCVTNKNQISLPEAIARTFFVQGLYNIDNIGCFSKSLEKKYMHPNLLKLSLISCISGFMDRNPALIIGGAVSSCIVHNKTFIEVKSDPQNNNSQRNNSSNSPAVILNLLFNGRVIDDVPLQQNHNNNYLNGQ